MGKKTAFFKRIRAVWQAWGYGLVLTLCFLVVLLTAYLSRAKPKEGAPAPTPAATASPTPAAVAAQAATALPLPTPRPLKLPAENARIGLADSGDGLLYNESLSEWRQHRGLDYLGEENTPVRAVFAGTIERVYRDALLGNCLVLRDESGCRCLYASLAEDIPVQAGDAVSSGQTVGFMGQSALIERGEGFHVHVELYDENGRPIMEQLPRA